MRRSRDGDGLFRLGCATGSKEERQGRERCGKEPHIMNMGRYGAVRQISVRRAPH